MNIITEVATLEPVPPFEDTINEIKDNHMKIIASANMNIPATTPFH